MDTVCAVKDHSSSMEEHINLLEKVGGVGMVIVGCPNELV